MKIIEKPMIYILGFQQVDDSELKRFLSDHGVENWKSDSNVGSEILCEIGGRVCYMSFEKPRPGGNSAYLNRIKESGHGSVLEHGVFNLLVTGVSRSFSHELVRHRAGVGVSQLSQRYVDESVAEYIIPDIIASHKELKELFTNAVEFAHESYIKLVNKLIVVIIDDLNVDNIAWDAIEKDKYVTFLKSLSVDKRTEIRKAARQAARSVLPNATETKVFLTMNIRAIRHVMEMRGSKHAEPEIRRFAIELGKLMKERAPNHFSDYEINETVETPYRKV